MPFNLKERPCQVCGVLVRRPKYCEKCAKIIRMKKIKEINKQTIQNRSDEQKDDYKSFTWDNPNDLITG